VFGAVLIVFAVLLPWLADGPVRIGPLSVTLTAVGSAPSLPPINLYSDTQTRPSEGMRAAIAAAVVGDEQRGLDPTTLALQDRVAELLGLPAAVFLPSGTMCNEIALRLHARPGGDELLLDRTAHPVNSEAGGPAQVAGLMVRVIDGDGGVFTGAQLEAALRPPGNRYMPRSRVVSVEQTSNLGGGRVWPLSVVQEVLAVARRHGLRAHMDGARLLNAVVASGVPAAEFASGFDTAWIDFTKGLGAPVGAVLAGSRELIDEAWRWKQMLGGAFRQSGIVAAGCLYALDHHVDRLADDHAHARLLARGLAELPGVQLDPDTVETNIVIFEVEDAPALVARIADLVEVQAFGPRRVRAVTHMDVSRADIELALEAFGDALA
jgi:threonine aldolase